MRSPSRRGALAAAIVVAAHLALLFAWLQGAVRTPGHAAPPRISVRLIAAAPPSPPPRPAEPTAAQPAHDPARRAPALPRADVVRRDAAAPQTISTQAIAPEAAASRPGNSATQATTEPLLDSEATRRALRASARDPGLAAQARRFGSARLTPDERLGAEVHRSAKGDCLKGEYLGGGMGLLSLPFLAAAAMREQCRR
jgi:hypothetical protein